MSFSDEALKLVDSTPQSQKTSSMFATRLNNLAVSYQHESRLSEADNLYKESYRIWQGELCSDHPHLALSLHNRASLCRLLGVFAEAERLQQMALRIWDLRGIPDGTEMTRDELTDDRPLWAEGVDEFGNPTAFQAKVRDLRRRVEAGSEDAHRELEDLIQKLGPWYHNLRFSDINTNGDDPEYPARRWNHFEPFVPENLEGKSVLDIGCDAGYFSLEMKRRQADRVVSIDIMPYRLAQVRFASSWFDLPLEPRELSVYDVGDLKSEFDFVIFPGVLYHLKHPLLALEKVSEVCRCTMFFQSAMRGSEADFTPAEDYPATETEVFDRPEFPKLYLIERSLNADESNWWFATRSCLKAMLRISGFPDISATSAADHFVCKKRPPAR